MATPVLWEPQPKQHLLLSCPVDDVLFGGARGGGKSDALLGDWWAHATCYPQHARGLLVRRSFPELDELIVRSQELFPATGGRWNEQRHVWTWKAGARLRLRPLEHDKQVRNLQGSNHTWLGADEMTNWPGPGMLDKLRATLRSAHGVPCYFRGTANPGGVGHNWVKKRYIDPAPPLVPFVDEVGTQRVFIPSTLDDNVVLTTQDPQYWQRVQASAAGREDLLKAWRYGLWDIVAGGMFDDLWDPAVHIVAPFRVPASWRVDRSHDWGSAKPFCTLWYAESTGEAVESAAGVWRSYPRGTLFVIAEDYGMQPGKDNEGIGGTPALICGRVKAVEAGLGRKAQPGPADDPLWDTSRGRAMIDEHVALGVSWLKPSKGPGSRITGWTLLRQRLEASLKQPMEKPGLFVFNTCRHLLRTLPVLPRDTRNPDDVDTEAEDHAADALRLKLLSIGTPMQSRRYTA
jgi:hypothetical protein